MLSINATLAREIQSPAVQPVFRVAITDGSTTWVAFSADPQHSDGAGYPIAVDRVDPIEATMDPITRATEIGSVIVTVGAEWFRPLVIANRMKGKTLSIQVGCPGLAVLSYSPYANNRVIERWTHKVEEKVFEIEALDPISAMLSTEIQGGWFAEHPLDVAYDIIVNKCGVPSSMVDATSFDPDTWTDISHYVVTRAKFTGALGDNSISSPTRAKDLIDQLAAICDGSVIVDETGDVKFVRFDPSVVDQHFTTDDYDGKIEIVEQGETFNRVSVNFWPTEGTSRSAIGGVALPELGQTYTQDDTDSQGDYAYPGGGDQVNALSIDVPWLFSAPCLRDTITDSATSGIVLVGALEMLAGGRESRPAASQPANNKISASRPFYVRIENEIIKATGLTFDDTHHVGVPTLDPVTGAQTLHDVAAKCTLTGVTRGALGTSAAAHTGLNGSGVTGLAWDYTVAVAIATPKIDRYNYGVDRIRIFCPGLAMIAVEVGDTVTLDNAHFAAYGIDGLSSSNKWEVTGKRVDAFGDGGITYELAYAATSTSTTRVHKPADVGVRMKNLKDWLADQRSDLATAKQIAKDNNFGLSSSGLDLTIGTGKATGSAGLRAALGTAATIPLGANKDNHLTLDILTGGVVVEETASGGRPSTPLASSTPLGVAVTGAATVSSTNITQRVTQAATAAVTAPMARGGGLAKNPRFSSASRG